jgi:hypothetical protein
MSTTEKIDELVKIQREFSTPARIEGKLDGHWNGEGEFSRCDYKFTFDIFIENSQVFGVVKATILDNNSYVSKYWPTSADINGSLSDGLFKDFRMSLEFCRDTLPIGTRQCNSISFFMDGDLTSGRITSFLSGDWCRSGIYHLSQVR